MVYALEFRHISGQDTACLCSIPYWLCPFQLLYQNTTDWVALSPRSSTWQSQYLVRPGSWIVSSCFALVSSQGKRGKRALWGLNKDTNPTCQGSSPHDLITSQMPPPPLLILHGVRFQQINFGGHTVQTTALSCFTPSVTRVIQSPESRHTWFREYSLGKSSWERFWEADAEDRF